MGARLERNGVIRLFETDPELIAHLDPPARAQATRQTVVDLIEAAPGDYGPGELAPQGDDLALLLVGGLLIRRLELFGRSGVELLGQGDVLPSAVGQDDTYTSLTAETSVRVLEAVKLAVLDREFERSAAQWPGVLARVLARVDDRVAALSLRLAIAKFTRLEDRLLCVLWQLADRWGRRTAEGVVLPLRLSHDVLADLTSARRPSVSEALKRLAEHHAVERRGRTWLLHGDPPQKLQALGAELALPGPSST